jgi:hypothetical protein
MADYAPQNPAELHYYNTLFGFATNQAGGELGGAEAVRFFKTSGVDVGFLKQIWALSTQGATMNVHQFYTAMRFLTMIQNGEFPISKGTFHSFSPLPLLSHVLTFLCVSGVCRETAGDGQCEPGPAEVPRH